MPGGYDGKDYISETGETLYLEAQHSEASVGAGNIGAANSYHRLQTCRSFRSAVDCYSWPTSIINMSN